jgi:hypothetical protein
MDSLKFHLGLPCPTFLRPAGMPPLKWPYGCFKGGLPARRAACGRLLPLLTPHAVRLCADDEEEEEDDTIDGKNNNNDNKRRKNRRRSVVADSDDDTISTRSVTTASTSTSFALQEKLTFLGGYHDLLEAKWLVIRGPLRGHNDTPCRRPTPGRPGGLALGLAVLRAYLVFSFTINYRLFLNMSA